MKQSLLSSWHGVTTTLAKTVGSPSAHRRGTMLKLLSVLVLILTIGVGNMWGTTTTLAGWTFTSESYPSNKTDFTATTGTMTTNSTFYLNGGGSTWNTGAGKGYAFTSVTDIDITLKLTQAVPAGTVFTLSATSFYNKASNAPMKSFDVTVKEGTGSFSTTGVTTTNWSLGTSSASKSSTYTTQAALASGSTIVFKLTGKDKAGSGQGYIGNITITATTYNVTYNGNSNTGGSVPTDNVKYITGTTVTVKANSGSLVRTNYTFGGWNTNTSGTGTNYAAGSGSFTITADKTLYAKWNAEAVSTPTLELTGSGAFGNVDVDATKDLNFTLAGSNLTANATVSVSGTGFSLVTPAGGSLTQTAGSITGSNNITVRFAPTAGGAHNGTLTVSSTGASDASVSLSGTGQLSDTFIDELHSTAGYTALSPHVEKGAYGTTPSITSKTPTTTGNCQALHYHFVGWITAAKYAEGSAIAVGDLQTPTSATGATYYAVWAKQGAGGGSFDGEHGGTFKIYAEINSTKYYAQDASTLSSGKLSNTTNIAEAGDFVIEAVTGGFTIKSGDLYIGYGSSTNLTSGNVAYTWTFEEGSHGTWRVNSGTSGRAWIYRSGTVNKFGGYSTGNVNGTEYYDLEIAGSTSWEDYRAVCCTELGSINGSFNRIHF